MQSEDVKFENVTDATTHACESVAIKP